MTDPLAASPAPPSPEDLGKLCRELALGGAAVVESARGAGMSVEAKSTATDLVTEVDRAAERWLTDELGSRRPGDAILGEEGGAQGAGGRVRWLLDPIDGTVNFVLGIPHYAVSVAVEVDGVVVAGAVANPASGETFTAVRGRGAQVHGPRFDSVRLGERRRAPLSRAVLGTGFGYDAALRARQVAVVAPLLPLVGDIRRLGSAALDLCFLAAGRLDGYFEAGLHDWDHAAGGLVAVEAGCVTSGLHGRPPSGRLYAAAAPQLAGELFALLETLGADEVLDPAG